MDKNTIYYKISGDKYKLVYHNKFEFWSPPHVYFKIIVPVFLSAPLLFVVDMPLWILELRIK